MLKINLVDVAAVAFGVTTVLGAVMAVLVYIITKNRSKSEYDADQRMAVLSEMRTSYENQIGRLTDQLMATEGRWRETNHLLISSQNHQSPKISNETVNAPKFVRNLGIDLQNIKVDKRKVFFLTPFSENERSVFNEVQAICAKNNLVCVRGDESQASGEILPHIVKLILTSRVIIANISSRNANVFYELGIAHAFDKPTILLANSPDALAFDIQSQRTILYANPQDLELKLTQTLLRLFSGDEVGDV